MNKDKPYLMRFFLFFLIFINLGLLSFLWIRNNRDVPEKYVFIDNQRLFNGFNMTKDLKELYNKKITVQAKQVDSLYKVYNEATKSNDKSDIRNKKLQFQKANQSLQQQQDYYAQRATQQVWTRLNKYIKEYAIKKSYKIVFGTRGDGTIMFGDSLTDITEDFIKFSNTKYEDIIKNNK